MIKSWQIFFFSLIPLVLVMTGVIIGSIHFSGGDSQAEVFPTPRPVNASGPPPTPVPGASQVSIKAQNLQFTTRSLSATAGTIQLSFDNADAGVLHNLAFFTNQGYTTAATFQPSKSELVAGPIVQTTTFTGVTAGTYYFRCEAHPDMTGALTVR